MSNPIKYPTTYFLGSNLLNPKVYYAKIKEIIDNVNNLSDGSISTTSLILSNDLTIGTDITLAKEVNHSIVVATTTTAATAGGNITVTAGTGTTSAAGGNVTIASAGSGTTGASGTANITTAAGGATSGASGDVNIVTGNTTIGTTGDIILTTGNSASGLSGDIILTTGTQTSTTVKSVISLNKALIRKPENAASTSASGIVITGPELVGGHITVTGNTGNVLLPTTAQITTAIGSTPTGTSFDFFVNTVGMTGANIATLVVGTNMTVLTTPIITGSDTLTVAQAAQGIAQFRIIYNSATTCKLIRVA